MTLIFTLTENLQAVCAGVRGQIQCEEDALRYPPQTFSQWTQKGIQNLFFIIIADSKVIQKSRPDTKKKLLLSSGADTGDVEQARHWKLSSPLDHHLGHSGWFAASGSSYLCAIQGQWTKAFSVLA